MKKTDIDQQISVIHGSSPEMYSFLMDTIQDAQSLGSIVQIITIIPPFLQTDEKGIPKITPLDCSPNQAVEPMKQ